jgi:hypothetical protein
MYFILLLANIYNYIYINIINTTYCILFSIMINILIIIIILLLYKYYRYKIILLK